MRMQPCEVMDLNPLTSFFLVFLVTISVKELQESGALLWNSIVWMSHSGVFALTPDSCYSENQGL